MNKNYCKKKYIGGYAIIDIINNRVNKFIKKNIKPVLNSIKNNNLSLLEQYLSTEKYEYIMERLNQFKKYTTVNLININLTIDAYNIVKIAYDIKLKNIILNEQLLKKNSRKLYSKIETSLKAQSSVGNKFLDYILKYGVPELGQFDPIKLAECS